LIDLLASGEPSPLSRLESDERSDWIRSELAELPETLRATVVLVYYQGLKYQDAADVLDIPVGTVKSRLHAAILKLNQAWAKSNKARE
jgi:RNA polymerase sigma-70 factor (ECF subfamily)